MRIIITFSLLLLTNQAVAVTAEGLFREFDKILKSCKNIGFYKCQGRYFQGDNRGLFHLPIEKQKLKLTEEKYREFIEKKSEDGVKVSFLKKTVNIDFKLEDKFDIEKFSVDNISGSIQPLNPDNTLFKFSFKNAPPIALVNVNNTYKIGILPEQEKEFRKTDDFKRSYIFRLKNNILRYHMKEAEMLKYELETLNRNVSEAQTPIMFVLEKGILPDFAKDFMSKKTMKDIQLFYINLDTDIKIINKIKQVHKL